MHHEQDAHCGRSDSGAPRPIRFRRLAENPGVGPLCRASRQRGDALRRQASSRKQMRTRGGPGDASARPERPAWPPGSDRGAGPCRSTRPRRTARSSRAAGAEGAGRSACETVDSRGSSSFGSTRVSAGWSFPAARRSSYWRSAATTSVRSPWSFPPLVTPACRTGTHYTSPPERVRLRGDPERRPRRHDHRPRRIARRSRPCMLEPDHRRDRRERHRCSDGASTLDCFTQSAIAGRWRTTDLSVTAGEGIDRRALPRSSG